MEYLIWFLISVAGFFLGFFLGYFVTYGFLSWWLDKKLAKYGDDY